MPHAIVRARLAERRPWFPAGNHGSPARTNLVSPTQTNLVAGEAGTRFRSFRSSVQRRHAPREQQQPDHPEQRGDDERPEDTVHRVEDRGRGMAPVREPPVRDRAEHGDADGAAERADEHVRAGDDAALLPADRRLDRDDGRDGDEARARRRARTRRRRPARSRSPRRRTVRRAGSRPSRSRRREAPSAGSRCGDRRAARASRRSASRSSSSPSRARRPRRRRRRTRCAYVGTYVVCPIRIAPIASPATLPATRMRCRNTQSGRIGSATFARSADEHDEQDAPSREERDARRRAPRPADAALEQREDQQRAGRASARAPA